MKVRIKSMKVDMDIKNTGIEFEIRGNDDQFLGDCFITKKGLIWCEGKKSRANGKSIPWDVFREWANGQ